MRGTVLVEDRRQERFARNLLRELGFNLRRFRFNIAPQGTGSAEAWVRTRYPAEVAVLRTKRYQTRLCLLAMRDGDAVGLSRRKLELDAALEAADQPHRGEDEPIATPVPTWSIETWLLHLLGQSGLDEDHAFKARFPPAGVDERTALTMAAAAWVDPSRAPPPLPSLCDGYEEIERLSP